MKILVKNKKWETSFERVTLICDVKADNDIFHIQFPFNGKNVKITSYNLDLTFRHLEKMFNKFSRENHIENHYLAS